MGLPNIFKFSLILASNSEFVLVLHQFNSGQVRSSDHRSARADRSRSSISRANNTLRSSDRGSVSTLHHSIRYARATPSSLERTLPDSCSLERITKLARADSVLVCPEQGSSLFARATPRFARADSLLAESVQHRNCIFLQTF